MIHYEPHPVSPERKAYLRGKGFRIVDAIFAPKGWENAEKQAVSEAEQKAQAEVVNGPKPRGRPRKVKDDADH